jgi:hypothetical protein
VQVLHNLLDLGSFFLPQIKPQLYFSGQSESV